MSPDLLTILIRRYSSNVEIPKRLFVLVKHRTQIYSSLIAFQDKFYQFVLFSNECGTDMDLEKKKSEEKRNKFRRLCAAVTAD